MAYSSLKQTTRATAGSLLLMASLLLLACNGVPLPNDNNNATCPPAPENVMLVDIKSIVDWINAMDKPLTLPCFVQSLPRPLKVNTSTYPVSAQPPLGKADPRVFLFFNELILSVVTNNAVDKNGVPPELQEHLLEFSYVTDWENTLSIKGELVFPITDTLSEEDAYKRVLAKEPDSATICNGCHGRQTQVSIIGNTPIYESEILKPTRGVKISDLVWYGHRCIPSEQAHRCRMYSSLLDYGELQWAEFPQNARTIDN